MDQTLGLWIIIGILVLYVLAYLWLLVTNPEAALKLGKQGQEQQKQSFDLMGKAIGGAANIASKFLKK